MVRWKTLLCFGAATLSSILSCNNEGVAHGDIQSTVVGEYRCENTAGDGEIRLFFRERQIAESIYFSPANDGLDGRYNFIEDDPQYLRRRKEIDDVFDKCKKLLKVKDVDTYPGSVSID